MKVKIALLIVFFLFPVVSHGLLVVGDSDGSSTYTSGTGAGSGWNYVGHLQGDAPSSATYVSNQWFITAHHVWDNDVIGGNETSVDLGGNTYTIDTDSKVAITNAAGTEADLCMFRVTNSDELPTGIRSMESTAEYSSELTMIGNGYDNQGNTGMTWGDGDIYATGNGANRSTYTATDDLNGRSTTYFLSVYDSTTQGSAYGQIFDSGGGTFVNSELSGIMVSIGTGIEDGVTYITDAATYGTQINAVSAVPESGTGILLSGIAVLFAFANRTRRMLVRNSSRIRNGQSDSSLLS